ncbi:endonuclease/exonuclease/phosphatase family protein [Gordonia neofelifaecis]|uniref:Endonuclease/exonuclease/phosphatase n=1 Tax=Gordonia neofelifaecis NRRL B-59395 TaxID=644548 RepID=F1YKP9_9ACTN|nr:endonuclease/exonuclease/phosphatase family protein [Gordonia neofelifaecis]EGD54693.1 Endonuclease/exonuclease/phosphatase [Gordonia neofelifaecis NRRL B-59395]
MSDALRRTGVVVGTVALVGAVGALAMRYWPGSHTVTIAAASVSPIVLLVGCAVAVTAFAAVRAWIGFGVAVVVAAAGVAVQAPLYLADDRSIERPLTVVSANIQLGTGDVDDLAELVRTRDVDVLAVQEITPEAALRIRQTSIAEDLPHDFVRPAALAYGTAVYSRHPLSQTAVLEGFALTTLTAVATVPGHGEVQVFAVHPVPPTHPEDWAEELDRIGAALSSVPSTRSVVALGDFNATTDHVQFRRLLSGGYRDAGEAAGAGWLPTYPTDKRYPPLVGIDHIVVRGLTATEVSSHEISGADHRAILAEIG